MPALHFFWFPVLSAKLCLAPTGVFKQALGNEETSYTNFDVKH